nr:MAG TPA: lipoprotein [Inoviridae sp.]
MDKFIIDIYSNGDLYMMMAKIFSWMVVMLLMAVILGCFRGLRL